MRICSHNELTAAATSSPSGHVTFHSSACPPAASNSHAAAARAVASLIPEAPPVKCHAVGEVIDWIHRASPRSRLPTGRVSSCSRRRETRAPTDGLTNNASIGNSMTIFT